MRTLTVKIAAGATEELAVKGNYVRIRTAPYELIIENPDTSEKVEASQGDDFELSAFKRLRVTNNGGIDSIFKLTISQDKKAGSAPGVISGTVAVAGGVDINSPVRSAGAQIQKTVTSANTVMVATNANRKYLLIQNKDATGIIYITFSAMSTIAGGIEIKPGGSFELNSNILTGAVNAIGSIASNNNVIVLEG